MTIKPEQLRFCESHEWAGVQGELATVGISAFAVAELTDLVFMAMPKVGQKVAAGEEFGEVESVKAVSPMYSPVSGEVVEVNDALANHLETLNTDPYDAGWIMKVKMSDPSELDRLLSWDAYQKQCGQN
ncbi:Glycine cleavage system H protein [Pirellula sp. SH-Sr6A]|uniref:glycine cleavage system protein GcvH n=1 Tax=Pirellula sp. SH-Sr6A TaxID=1632865 RepID=UPI00078ED703|nr:glycine cleavage system protein GcvH [Pirellula sp. SH-Sr6A]AMV31379.1 Glycine cleavage system H protein [Pirellula sp. SH-Sr6A]